MRTAVFLLFCATPFAHAGPLGLRSSAITPGGGTSSGGSFALVSAIGQPSAQHSAGGALAVETGFLGAMSANQWPIASPDVVLRAPNEDFKIEIKQLLANDFDPDGGSLAISIPTTTQNGATLRVSRGWIYYTHTDPLSDSFSYTVTDARGTSIASRVDIMVNNDPQIATLLTIAPLDPNPGARVSFFGIPNRQFIVQHADGFDLLAPWVDFGPANDLGFGRYEFIDSQGAPVRFYRVVYRE